VLKDGVCDWDEVFNAAIGKISEVVESGATYNVCDVLCFRRCERLPILNQAGLFFVASDDPYLP